MDAIKFHSTSNDGPKTAFFTILSRTVYGLTGYVDDTVKRFGGIDAVLVGRLIPTWAFDNRKPATT